MIGQRLFLLSIAMVMVFCLGAGTAYSGLRAADKRVISIAYANGYKDALEYAFKVDRATLDALKDNPEHFKTKVLYEADAYVDKVSGLNQ